MAHTDHDKGYFDHGPQRQMASVPQIDAERQRTYNDIFREGDRIYHQHQEIERDRDEDMGAKQPQSMAVSIMSGTITVSHICAVIVATVIGYVWGVISCINDDIRELDSPSGRPGDVEATQ